MTYSQTVAIDTKAEFNPEPALNMSITSEPHKLSHSVVPSKSFGTIEKDVMHLEFNEFLASLSEEDQKKCKFDCDESEMIMTEVLDEYVQAQEQISEQNRADHFQSNVSFAPVAGSDDMEVTRSQTVVLDTRCGGEPFSSNTGITTRTENISPGALAASEIRKCKKAMALAKSTVFHNDQSDFVELTCQTSTGVLSPSLNDSVKTGCSNVAMDSKDSSTANVISKSQASFMLPPSVSPEVKRADRFISKLSLSHMVDDMEMTQCHTECELEKTCHTVCDDMEMTECLTVCDLEKTCHTMCDDIELTQCQTVVLETKSYDDCKPSNHKSMKRLSLLPRSFKNKSMIHEHIEHMELNRYSFSKRTKAENCQEPTAQRFCLQDLSDCMEIQQGTASDIPVIHDDMELTGCKNITIDTKNSWVTSPSNMAPCGFSSRPTINEMNPSILEKLGTGHASQAVDCKSPVSTMDLDAGNLVDKQKEAISDVAGMNFPRDQTVDKGSDLKIYKPSSSRDVNEHMTLNSTVKGEESSKEDCNMEITRAFTVPLEEQCFVAFNQEEMAREVVVTTPVITNQNVFKEADYTLPVNHKTVSSAKKVYIFESDIDTLKKTHSSSVKSRRRSLADLQMKLQNISQYISEPDRLLAGSVTAPLISFTEVSPVEKHSEQDNSLQTSKRTPLLVNKINLAHKEVTTPFNLKNSLMSRLSVGGIMPNFPPKARLASPNQTEPKSPNDLQGVQLQTCFSADVQNGSYETDLIDEVLPEEDLSGTLISYQSENKEQEITGVHLKEDAIEYDHMESEINISSSEKMQAEEKDTTMKDTSKKLVR